MLRLVLLVGSLVLLNGCTMSRAPLWKQPETVCENVRQQVKLNQYPLDLAQRWYAECSPFEVGTP